MADFSRDGITILEGDCREVLPTLAEASVDCCVTSPPYWGLRDYGMDGQIGLEDTPDEYVSRMVEVFREVRRVLKDEGTLWLNLGDSYHNLRTSSNGGCPTNTLHRGGSRDGTEDFSRSNRNRRIPGLKEKDLVGIPWRVAFALQADGWYLRQDIIWHKPNPMPESVKDRCVKSHEYIFLLAKSRSYYFDNEAIQEPANYAGQSRGGSTNRYEQNESGMDCREYDTRTKRSVWTVKPTSSNGAHFAVFPEELITPCIQASCPEGGTVLDPFTGSGTTAAVAQKNGCKFIGCELNPEYVKLAAKRFQQRSMFRLAD